MAVLTITVPSVTFELPDSWRASSSDLAPCIAFGTETDGFTSNVTVQQDRVPSEVTIEQLADLTYQEVASQHENAEIRDQKNSAGAVDRVIQLAANGKALVQYQRLILVEGSLGSHWFVRMEATCAASQEETLRPVFIAGLNSLRVG